MSENRWFVEEEARFGHYLIKDDPKASAIAVAWNRADADMLAASTEMFNLLETLKRRELVSDVEGNIKIALVLARARGEL